MVCHRGVATVAIRQELSKVAYGAYAKFFVEKYTS